MSEIGTILIVGASLTGAKAAEALRKEGYDGRIVMFGEEPQPPYLRPPLSKERLRGEDKLDKLFVHPEAWYAEQRIELRLSTLVRAIEPATREVVLDNGQRMAFDRLLIATGAAPRRLNIPGGDLGGVHYLRTLEDADAIRDAVTAASRAVVIGGGWIGAEVAASIRQLGLPVAMIADGSVPLERVLGAEVGSVYRDLHAERGVELVMHQRAVAFRGQTAIEAVETADGRRIEGDLVVVGVGAQPRIGLAADAGLDVADGILVDEMLETSVPGIFAAGDVAAAWHPLLGSRLRVEHWDNARRQGRAAARNMLGKAEPYLRIPYFYSDQYDLSMEYAGYAPAWDQVVFRGEPASRSFVAFWLTEGRVVAGMNANVLQVNDAIAALVGSKDRVAVERLVDPAVPLDDLEALLLPGQIPVKRSAATPRNSLDSRS
jgi:3-phenylpropionate/trans-cinnamate dioxygenase ferredoxin reductase subunit